MFPKIGFGSISLVHLLHQPQRPFSNCQQPDGAANATLEFGQFQSLSLPNCGHLEGDQRTQPRNIRQPLQREPFDPQSSGENV
ncbi:MAG: hypothetical protein ACI9BW_003661 [Gammaproteobacteria bacterium]